MPTRREFVQTGLSAVALGLLRRTGFAMPWWRDADHGPPWGGLASSRPFLEVPNNPPSLTVDGLPFAEGWFGDPFPQAQIPFHGVENGFPNDTPPPPTETVDIAIVGGGLSGLSTAYFLRHRYPVLFELHDRFGGVSKGEIWHGQHYSQGGAYFMTPDDGDFLESFYHELGLDHVHQFSAGGDDPVELNGAVLNDFWSGAGLSPEEVMAFQKYAQIVDYFANVNYPDIPLDESQNNDWIMELDLKTLKQDIEDRMGMPVPQLLAAGIQGYCYSSFNAGWDQISAASGWNFIAAEEFGRWVCPGGNAWVVDELWQRLVHHYQQHGNGNNLNRLRPGTRVVDVRMADGGMAQVTYKTPQNEFKSLLARRVVLACSKHICKYMLQGAQQLDLDKYYAMASVITNPYVVVNVLLNSPMTLDFYDLFLLGDGVSFPMSEGEVTLNSRVTDMLNGSYAAHGNAPRSVLTLYWPLPWSHAVFTLITDGTAWQDYAQRVVPQINFMLGLLNIPNTAVRQVRMTRWGHAMPIAYPGFIATGVAAELRRPFQDIVYFVNQDNWALPAFETSVLEARTFATTIDESF